MLGSSLGSSLDEDDNKEEAKSTDLTPTEKETIVKKTEENKEVEKLDSPFDFEFGNSFLNF